MSDFPQGVAVALPGQKGVDTPRGTRVTWWMPSNLSTDAVDPNQLSELLESGAFDATTTLRVSSVSSKLTHLPPNIERLTALDTLVIENPKFTDFERTYRLHSLPNLVLRNIREPMPEGIGAMRGLRTLKIHNGVAPADLGSLPALESLALIGIKALPDSVSQLRTLQHLKLDSNSFTRLPEDFGNLISLVELHVSFSKLKALPESVGALPKLEVIVVSSAGTKALKKLPSEIRWPNARVVDLQGGYAKFPKVFEVPMVEEVLLGEDFRSMPPLTSERLRKVWINAPLDSVDARLAAVPHLRLSCTKAAYAALDEETRSVFGSRLTGGWS